MRRRVGGDAVPRRRGAQQAHNNLAIALYDPGATPAVASITFATPTGPQSPPAFQGVLVAAGHTVVLYAAHALPFRRFVSAKVAASGGAIVAGALDIVGSRGAAYDALESAVPTPATQWYFAAAPAGASAQQTFDLENPGKRTAEVEISLGGSSGVGKIALQLGPGATTRYTPAADESAAAVRWASVTSTNKVPIVAARELYLGTALAVPPSTTKGAAARRRRLLLSLPTLPVGLTVDPGCRELAKDWIVAGGESGRRVSRVRHRRQSLGGPGRRRDPSVGRWLRRPRAARASPRRARSSSTSPTSPARRADCRCESPQTSRSSWAGSSTPGRRGTCRA